METSTIKDLFKKFESAAATINGIECWFARELQTVLGYTRWENFQVAMGRAIESCKSQNINIDDHFREVTKMVVLGSGARREVTDFMLTRYACYLIAQNGDPKKEEIAFAQTYFALQTRTAELIEQRILDNERLIARGKLKESEARLSDVVYDRGIKDSKDFAVLRSKGDYSLFHLTTEQAKVRFKVPKGRPLADFLPTIDIKAKDFAAAMTATNVEQKNICGQAPIEREHCANNAAVRETMIKRGIVPEKQSPAEDIKKVESRIKQDAKALPSGTPKKIKP